MALPSRLGAVALWAGTASVFPVPLDARAADQPLASVRFILRGLTVTPPHAAASRATINQPLFKQYSMLTAANQKASIGFRDGTVLHMNQRTDAVLRSPTLTFVRRGEVSEIEGAGLKHTISTATAVASALGTVFDVRITPPGPSAGRPVLPPGTTTVSVVTGVVRVSNGYGSVRVPAGRWTHVRPGQAPTRPTAHNAGADIRWATGLP